MLSECVCILIDCSQLSKTYYNVLFGSFTWDCRAQRIYWRTKITQSQWHGRKPAIISSCSVLPPEIVMHDAYIGGCSENNIKCVVLSCIMISGGRTEQLDIIAGFLPRHWLYKWFSKFLSCGTYSVLSRCHSVDCMYVHCIQFQLIWQF